MIVAERSWTVSSGNCSTGPTVERCLRTRLGMLQRTVATVMPMMPQLGPTDGWIGSAGKWGRAIGLDLSIASLELVGIGNLGELAMQNSETTLCVSSEGGCAYSMPYPLTPSTVPTEYEKITTESDGIAVSP